MSTWERAVIDALKIRSAAKRRTTLPWPASNERKRQLPAPSPVRSCRPEVNSGRETVKREDEPEEIQRGKAAQIKTGL
jgi:hypothetical protein